MPLLKVEHLSSGYGKKQVLFDVSFEVGQGEIVLVAGSNGSGKSTLLKTIYGLLPLWKGTEHEGRVYFDGELITGKPAFQMLKKGLVYVPQKNNVFENLTVKENLEISGISLGSRKLLCERIAFVLDTFPQLVPHLKKIPMKLSGGERQLLSLGMTILHQSKIILMDEPFAGVSPKYVDAIMSSMSNVIKKLSATIIIVEHRIKEVYPFSSSVIALKYGSLFKKSRIDDNLHLNDLRSVFI